MSTPLQFLQFVDNEVNANKFVERLKTAVAIKSVSGDISCRQEVFKMANFLESELQALGAVVRKVPLGKQARQQVDLPPVILAQVGNDSKLKTILCYGHYDVQPARREDGWNTEPFTLKEIDGKLFGRGSSDDKGPLLGWLNVLQAHKKLQLQLPVNLRLCFEGMEESGSEKLDELIRNDEFFKGVDAICISDNTWLNNRTPCLTYGLRGIIYFKVTISGPTRDLHSGEFGGVVHEPMTDLIQLMSKLVTPKGKILVPGVNELVAPLTDAERKLYEALDYSVQDVEQAVGAAIALSNDKVTVLMGRMRYPSLSLHGIEGDFSGPGAKTIIPAKVSGKFSIRLVPNQMDLKVVAGLITKYLHEEFNKLGTKSKMNIDVLGDGKPWVADKDHWNYVAGQKATKAVYNKEPNFTREGGSIPVTLTLQDHLHANVLLLPMGRGDDGAHSTNEKLDRSNFINGTKLLGTYLYELAAANP